MRPYSSSFQAAWGGGWRDQPKGLIPSVRPSLPLPGRMIRPSSALIRFIRPSFRENRSGFAADRLIVASYPRWHPARHKLSLRRTEMHPRFASVVNGLHASFERLISMEPVKGHPPPRDMPISGVYLFSEGDHHLYVGRSNRLRKRYFLHCRPGSQQNQASFAFKLAREATNSTKATYKKGHSRKDQSSDGEFQAAFATAKTRIANMDYRFVEEIDQTKQAILELYVSIVLQTPYNDFNTH